MCFGSRNECSIPNKLGFVDPEEHPMRHLPSDSPTLGPSLPDVNFGAGLEPQENDTIRNSVEFRRKCGATGYDVVISIRVCSSVIGNHSWQMYFFQAIRYFYPEDRLYI